MLALAVSGRGLETGVAVSVGRDENYARRRRGRTALASGGRRRGRVRVPGTE